MEEPTITPEELKRDLKKYFIVDVREPGEFSAGKIPGAINIPLGSLEHAEARGKIPKDKNIVVNCLHGIRGKKACLFLLSKKYDVRNLKGGYAEWVS